MTHHVALQFAVKTDTGLVRAHNEDAVELAEEYRIAVLADGMGGYNAGEVASGIATSVFRTALQQLLHDASLNHRAVSSKALQRMVVESVVLANARILEAARNEPEFSGMGTTLVAALFHHDRVVLAHIGDSRAYRFRHGVLAQLTRDHSQLQEQIDAGLVSPEWARFAPNKNLITRALGVAEQIDVEINDYPVEGGDIYLLCSDGLSDMLSREQMTAIFKYQGSNLQTLCDALIVAANNNGGRDNISVILAQVDAGTPVVSPSDRLGRIIARFNNWWRPRLRA